MILAIEVNQDRLHVVNGHNNWYLVRLMVCRLETSGTNTALHFVSIFSGRKRVTLVYGANPKYQMY